MAVPRRWSAVSRNVVLLGLTSLLTDVSSESLTAVLPLYFMLELRMTPLQFGLLDGLYQGASALVRVAGGLVADAGRRYKPVAFVGYALSAFCKLGLLLVGSAWAPIAALLMIDRLGKGVRTAPRDALITLSSEPTGSARPSAHTGRWTRSARCSDRPRLRRARRRAGGLRCGVRR